MDTSFVMPLEVTTSSRDSVRSPLRRHHAYCLWICLFLLLTGAPQLAAQATPSDSGQATGVTAGESQDAPRHTGMKDLPGDLLKNSLQLFSRNNLLPLIVGAGIGTAAHPADADLREYFDRPRLGRAGDVFGARLGSGPVVAAAIGSLWVVRRFRTSDEFAQFSYDLTEASALNGLLTFGLKHSIHRSRPSGGNYSFPSGHTSAAFAVAAVVDHHYGWKASVMAYAAATFIGASRIDSRKHYLSDVVAGATVGYIAGRTATHDGGTKHGLRWTPIVSSSSQTVGIALSWDPHHD